MSTEISIADWMQVGILTVGIVGIGAGALNRWAVANHRDRLAMLTSAAANAAGRINNTMLEAGLQPTDTAAIVRHKLVQSAAANLTAEFGTSAPKIDATVSKVAGIIDGQLGLLPAPIVGTPATEGEKT